jgi:hypothetical protein
MAATTRKAILCLSRNSWLVRVEPGAALPGSFFLLGGHGMGGGVEFTTMALGGNTKTKLRDFFVARVFVVNLRVSNYLRVHYLATSIQKLFPQKVP